MKNLNDFIFEGNDQSSSLGKKILSLIEKDNSDIVKAILKRTEKWDENKFDWTREPMFLIADKDSESWMAKEEHVRLLTWVRKKFFHTLDWEDGIEGTLENYNIANDQGNVPKSVLGVYFDRQFYPITSLDVYNKIRNIIEQQSN